MLKLSSLAEQKDNVCEERGNATGDKWEMSEPQKANELLLSIAQKCQEKNFTFKHNNMLFFMRMEACLGMKEAFPFIAKYVLNLIWSGDSHWWCNKSNQWKTCPI